MDIDFNSLSFKIAKPAFDSKSSVNSGLGSLNKYKIQQYLGSEDTQASQCQQQTIDPFRRTFHLFKHVEKQKKNQSQQKIKMQKTLSFNTQSDIIPNVADNQTVYSLQNFDSFKNFDSKADAHQLKQIKPIKNQYNQSSYIKIENQCQLSDEFSLIMDDLSYQGRHKDNYVQENERRIKTEYNQQKQKTKKIRKQNDGFFCLTAQEESSTQSNIENIKQFYFDLRDSKEGPQAKSLHSIDYPTMKKQIKSEIYKFIDELEIMSEKQIDQTFLKRLRECFSSVKKEQQELKVQKWSKKVKRDQNNEKTVFQLYEAAKTYELSQKKNKENKMMCKNMEQRPKIYKTNQKITQLKPNNQKQKKKWF